MQIQILAKLLLVSVERKNTGKKLLLSYNSTLLGCFTVQVHTSYANCMKVKRPSCVNHTYIAGLCFHNNHCALPVSGLKDRLISDKQLKWLQCPERAEEVHPEGAKRGGVVLFGS